MQETPGGETMNHIFSVQLHSLSNSITLHIAIAHVITTNSITIYCLRYNSQVQKLISDPNRAEPTCI